MQGASALDPLYGYQQDVANTNLNKSASEAIARQNLYAKIGGSAISTGGTLINTYAKSDASKTTTAAVV